MIKRALGLWTGGGDAGEDDDDEDDQLTSKQKNKLMRRLLPGGEMNSSKRQRSQVRIGGLGDDSEDDDEEQEEEDGDEEGRSESDDDPAMPPSAETEFRGKFRCQLCPHKILLNEKLMEQHLQSASHKRNEKRLSHAKEVGVEAYEAECRARAEAREAIRNGESKKKKKNADFWAKRRQKSIDKKKGKTRKDKAQNLTSSKIEARKQAFQAKKARRLARKSAVPAESGADPLVSKTNGEKMKKKKTIAGDTQSSKGKKRKLKQKQN